MMSEELVVQKTRAAGTLESVALPVAAQDRALVVRASAQSRRTRDGPNSIFSTDSGGHRPIPACARVIRSIIWCPPLTTDFRPRPTPATVTDKSVGLGTQSLQSGQDRSRAMPVSNHNQATCSESDNLVAVRPARHSGGAVLRLAPY